MKALIVEDSRSYQQLMENVLNNLGLSTRCVTNGREALRWISNENFDLICLDLKLPDIDGFELCQQLRNDKTTSLIPIIILTAEEDKVTLKQGYDAGVTEIFRKSKFSVMQQAITEFVGRMRRVFQGRVLYVEDSETVAQMTMHILNSEQLDVVRYKAAETALASFQQEDYDLVITDMILEGELTGMGLVRAIRALKDDRSLIPVLVISGAEDKARGIEVLRQGANDYITKPIIKEELIARISNLITTKHLFDQVKAQKEELRTMAMTDQLTGVYNRHYLHDMTEKYISIAYRQCKPLSLILLDIDHFKAVNDTHGHHIGDCVLMEIGGLLKKACRSGDLLARFGGEEFIMVLQDCDLNMAVQKAESIRQQIEDLQPSELSVTASFGVATLPDEKQITFEDLFKNADQAGYKAKEMGRNQVQKDEQREESRDADVLS
jgi:diguanylate cyclase (GGDEF)-like protein